MDGAEVPLAGSHIRVLLVEDNPADTQALIAAFADVAGTVFGLRCVGLLADAIRQLRAESCDIVLLDLNLPDSQGFGTFLQLHEVAPTIPVLVLTDGEDAAEGETAIEKGAVDHLSKTEARAPLLARSIRYAVERNRLRQELAQERQRARHAKEIGHFERISLMPGTSVTAQIYSGRSLRESALEQFDSIVERYQRLLEIALNERVHKEGAGRTEQLRELATELGFLRAGARDVIEIHSTALKLKSESATWQKAQAYLEEGRLTVLELMGNLANYYRSFYAAPHRQGHRK